MYVGEKVQQPVRVLATKPLPKLHVLLGVDWQSLIDKMAEDYG